LKLLRETISDTLVSDLLRKKALYPFNSPLMARAVVVVERILEYMDLPADLFVRPVENADDIFAFQFPVHLEGKALDDGTNSAIVEELDDGDLIIEGWAAEFEGQDRQGENFTEALLRCASITKLKSCSARF
jgi:hypothetical protein